METCPSCAQENPDEARFCLHCGETLAEITTPPESEASTNSSLSESDRWQALIGPNRAVQFSLAEGWSWRPAAEYYLAIFKRFHGTTGPRFSLTWHWPAFLFDPFLWFLYRKMYMYALVYAIGPVVSAMLTGDLTVGIVWRIIAGASANYIYYWHLKDQLQSMSVPAGLDASTHRRILGEEGGVQTYVLWLGVALHLLMFGVIIAAMEGGEPTLDPFLEPGELDEPRMREGPNI